MKRLKNILLEGRIEDAQQYFENAVGDWPVAELNNHAGIGDGTNLEGVLQHFVNNDPSGNNKYLMWMVKMYVNPEERGTSPNDISSLAQRFHKNIDRIHPAFINSMDIFNPASRIATSPKNIDSYEDISQLERVLDEIESIQTRKQTEDKAKKGAEKLYEDNRWLVVKPHTLEASCYYGAGTKWCTTEKDSSHFKDYSSKGPLYYIIDKSRQLGRFYKIAMHITWDGKEEYYDERDKLLEGDVLDAIQLLLPKHLQQTIFNDWEDDKAPEKVLMSLNEFRAKLGRYIEDNKDQQTISTNSGEWFFDRNPYSGTWEWISKVNPDIIVQATPFNGGENAIPFDSEDIEEIDSPDNWGITFGADFTETPHLLQQNYLDPNPGGYHSNESYVRMFLNAIYRPLVKQVLDGTEVKKAVGAEYSTWKPQSFVSSYVFKYPPKKGSMTQLFTDYIKQNPGSTANEFYMDILGHPRPRAHNNMFFASIKDSGIVKMERDGRQFVYSLGPNYQTWTEGKLLRSNRKYQS